MLKPTTHPNQSRNAPNLPLQLHYSRSAAPYQRVLIGLLGGFLRCADTLFDQGVVIPAGVQRFPDTAAHLEMKIECHHHIAGIEQNSISPPLDLGEGLLHPLLQVIGDPSDLRAQLSWRATPARR